MIALLITRGVLWLIIGLALIAVWYLLAPLFTPGSAKRGSQRHRHKSKETNLEVIDGKGRIIE
jgi:hypothetical protein